jgi:5-methylcytosine-specific restriction endonuclease McrA
VRRTRAHNAQHLPVDGVRRAAVPVEAPRPFVARSQCERCQSTKAWVVVKGRQATIRCAQCDRVLYNAPRRETGAERRTVRTRRRSIRPSQQARILNRDHGCCILCGRRDELTIAHLVSLEDGYRLGLKKMHLYCDANLAAMCESCNLGLRHSLKSVTARTYLATLWRLVEAEASRSSQTSLELGDDSWPALGRCVRTTRR